VAMAYAIATTGLRAYAAYGLAAANSPKSWM
jgi:hypothetical protein